MLQNDFAAVIGDRGIQAAEVIDLGYRSARDVGTYRWKKY
jgi:hypothetical protein